MTTSDSWIRVRSRSSALRSASSARFRSERSRMKPVNTGAPVEEIRAIVSSMGKEVPSERSAGISIGRPSIRESPEAM